MIWPCGSIVRYGKELYKAEAEMNSAEPGTSSQSRFYVSQVALLGPQLRIFGLLGPCLYYNTLRISFFTENEINLGVPFYN